jgi:L-asparaginase
MKIAIIYTGGTIGCNGSPLEPMSKNEFKRLFDIHIDINVDFLDFADTIDSTDIKPQQWCDIAQSIIDHYTNYDSFVVLHGTDTISYSLAMVSFILQDIDKPIIFSASQYPLFKGDNLNQDSDGYSNLIGAIKSCQKDIKGVNLYFANKLLKGTKVIKTNSYDYDAFSTPSHKEVVKTTKFDKNYKEKIAKIKEKNIYLKNSIKNTKVAIFKAFVAQKEMLDTLLDTTLSCVDGIVLLSFGAGNFPNKKYIFEKYKDIIVLNSSQVLDAKVDSSIYSSGSWLRDIKACDTLHMSYITAYVKLVYLLSLKDYYNYSKDDIKRLITTNLCGELD